MTNKNDIITFTKSNLPYGWMGNMAGSFEGRPLTIEYDNKIWKTSENLFQALRFEDIGIQGLIRKENGYNGKQVAKRFSGDMSVRPLSRQDVRNMIKCVTLKVEQHPELKKMLIETGESIIIEDVTLRIGGTGMFWGAAKLNQHWIGHNVLGYIWMYVRDDVQSQVCNYGGGGEDDFINFLFDRITSTENICEIVCIKALDECFYEGDIYYLEDEDESYYYVRNVYGRIIEFDKDDKHFNYFYEYFKK